MCGSRSKEALKTLQELTGSNNKENPWLGVCAAVALLRRQNDSLRKLSGRLAGQQIESSLDLYEELKHKYEGCPEVLQELEPMRALFRKLIVKLEAAEKKP